MFEVGFSELLLIMGLALLVLGPEKLPKVVSEIGRWMGRARAMARQFREQLEIEAAESARKKTTTSTPNPPDETPVDATPADSTPLDSTPPDLTTPNPETPHRQDDERRAP